MILFVVDLPVCPIRNCLAVLVAIRSSLSIGRWVDLASGAAWTLIQYQSPIYSSSNGAALPVPAILSE